MSDSTLADRNRSSLNSSGSLQNAAPSVKETATAEVLQAINCCVVRRSRRGSFASASSISVRTATHSPSYTGDNFTLTTDLGQISPVFTGNSANPCLGNLNAICDFNISWSETAGELVGISISIQGGDGDIGVFGGIFGNRGFGVFGLDGGAVDTDNG
jgi:hypothetical protein